MKVNFNLEDKLLVLELEEELDHHSIQRIIKRIDYEIQRVMPQNVIIDFKKVKFMDSAGIGLILGRYKLIKTYNGNLILRNVSKNIKRILEMSGILKIIDIIETIEDKKIS